MKYSRVIIAIVIAVAMIVSLLACSEDGKPSADGVHSGNSNVTGSGAIYQNEAPTNEVDTSFAKSEQDMFTDRDTRTTYEQGIVIELNGESASCESSNVSIDRGSVTIRADGTYVLRGELTDGAVYVNAPDTAKMQLVLDGVSIHNSTGAALCILGADKVFITMTPDSKNTLSSGQTFTPIGSENVDAALYSKQDITLNGSGSLTVNSPAGHGIVGKDDVVITGGAYMITAASHGIDANDSVRIQAAALTIEAGKDAVHVENTGDTTRGFFYMQSGSLTANAQGDGIDASAYLQIEGGAISLCTGGGYQNGEQHTSSMGGPGGPGGRPGGMGWNPSSSSTSASTDGTSTKGMKASQSVLINGGTIEIDSADDAIHSNQSAVIADGTLSIKTGDDGIHADEYLTVSGGVVRVEQSYEGLEALHIEICGGDIALICSDDGINAAGGKDESGFGFGGDKFGGRGGNGGAAGTGSILISGGSLYINASGDGIDANGTLKISGGLTTVCGPTQGDTAVLDYDRSGEITGGTFIGTGAQMMAQTFSASEQGVIALRTGNQAANTPITLTDASGAVILSYEPAMPYQIVIISTPTLEKGASYTVTVGDQSDTFEAK